MPEYVLEETPNLAGAWTNAPTGASNQVSVTFSAASKFYRLRYIGTAIGNFTLGAPLMTQFVGQGGTTFFDITISPSGGFRSPVTLSVSGLPAGTTGYFAPNPVYPPSTPGSAAKLLLKVGLNTAPRSYDLTVTAQCGSMTRTTGLTLMVLAPDFNLSASTSSSQTIGPGAEARFPFYVYQTGALSNYVSLSVTGLPAGVTAVFAPNPVANTNRSDLTVTTSSSVPAGTYKLTVTGVSGGLIRSSSVDLTIDSSADFSLSAPMMSLSVNQGETGTNAIGTIKQNNFGGAIHLNVSGLPAGASAWFDPNPALASSSSGSGSTLCVTAGKTTPAGTYALEVTGTSGLFSRKTWISLNVVAPDFSLSASPSTQYIPPGAGTQFPISISRMVGFKDPVSFGVSGLPAGVTAVFAPSPSNTNSTLLKVTTPTNLPAGRYALTVTGVSGTLTHHIPVELAVVANLDFTLGAPMMTMEANQGGGTAFDIDVFSPGLFGGAVNFSVEGVPANAKTWFDPNPGYQPSPFGRATALYIDTSTNTPAGVYTLVVTGTCVNIVRKTWLTLLVVAPGFSVSAWPSLQSIAPGQNTNYSVSVSKVGGFSNFVYLTVSGLPAGADGYISAAVGGNPILNVLTTSQTPYGTYPLTITGAANLGGGNSLTHTQTVVLEIAPASFTLNGVPGSQSIDQGDTTTYTVSVEPLRGYDGYVRLSFDGLPDGATAWFNHNPIYTYATLTVTAGPSTPPGNYNIQVTGTEGGLNRSTSLGLTVREPLGFNLSTSPSSQTLNPGGHATYTVWLSRTGGFSKLVNLAVSGLPLGATYSLDLSSLSILDVKATLTVNTASGTPVGSYPITITGISDTLTRSTTPTLVIKAPSAGDFTLDPWRDTQSLTAGASVRYDISIDRSNFTGPVTLSVSGLPTGATASFSPNPATGGSSTLTVTTSASTPGGTSTLKVTGTSGSLTRTADLTLTVGTLTTPDFSITTSPSSRTISPGMTAGYDLLIKPINGFYYAISDWHVTGLPAGLAGLVYVPLPENGGPLLQVTASPQAPKGTYTFTVTCTLYGGNANKTHTVEGTVVVTDPDFSMTLAPDSRITAPGGSVGYEVNITSIAGFYYRYSSWEISGLPPSATGFVYTPLPENGPPILVVQTSSGTPLGSYDVTVTATLSGGSGKRTESATATVVVHEPDYNLSLSPAIQTVSPGGTAGYLINVESIAGFTYNGADYIVSGLPHDISQLVYVPLPENGPPFVNLTANSACPKGTYTFTLTTKLYGISPAQTHSTQGTIVVQ